MPARNSLKQYLPNSYYHLYNRGVEKRKIFIDDQDYGVFLGYIKEYLSPKNTQGLQKALATPSLNSKERAEILKTLRLNNFYEEIYLLAYCLMPNHFHFLIRQRGATSIDKYVQSLCTRYTMYINRKYKRVGSLFQAVYKAVLISNDEQLLQLSKYIHKQSNYLGRNKFNTQPSSYPEHLNKRKTDWIHQEEILAYFSRKNPHQDYRAFVEEEQDFSLIHPLVIED